MSYLFSALEAVNQGRILIYCGTRKQTESWPWKLAKSTKGFRITMRV